MYPIPYYQRLDGRVSDQTKLKIERKLEQMRIGKSDEKKVIVTIKTSVRATEGKMKGKFVYETFESIDVYEATPEEVTAAVTRGLASATQSSGKKQ